MNNNVEKSTLKKKRVIVVGSSGYIGTHLNTVLTTKSDIEVSTINRKGSTNTGNAFSNEDFLNTDRFRGIFKGADVVIHLVGLAHKKGATFNDFININAKITDCVAKAAAAENVRKFIYISSIGVNGEESKNTDFSFDSVEIPQRKYAISKLIGEMSVIKNTAGSKTSYVILRPPLVYGVGAPGNVKTIEKAIRFGIPLPVGLLSQNQRSFISRELLCEMIWSVIQKDTIVNEIFLVSDKTTYSTKQFIELVGSMLQIKPKIFSMPLWLLKLILRLTFNKNMIPSLFLDCKIDQKELSRFYQLTEINHSNNKDLF